MDKLHTNCIKKLPKLLQMMDRMNSFHKTDTGTLAPNSRFFAPKQPGFATEPLTSEAREGMGKKAVKN